MARAKLRVVREEAAGEREREGTAVGAAAGAPESENRLTIEQLAQESGLSVRNIRSHQARGLLQPPEVRMRVGYYGPSHVARLRTIQELQAEGVKLEGIKRLLDRSPTAAERLLRAKEAVESPAEVESPEVVTGAELRARFDLSEEDARRVLEKTRKLRVLVPIGEDHYEVPSPSLLEAAEEVVRRGYSLAHVLELVEELTRHSEAVSRRFVRLFLEDVWKPFADAGMPGDQWPAVAETMERTRPLAAQALLGVFRQTMRREVETAFDEITRRLAEGKAP